MVRGTGTQVKVHYHGTDNDYIVFVEDTQSLEKWKSDSSIPLAQVVSGFKIFETGKQGAQGKLAEASNNMLENEFGTSNEDECLKKILEKGSVQETEASTPSRAQHVVALTFH
ncbi:MAG: hypothetical protein M1814_005394 [Vezdaea aestivalis]|nr:MAG: hypothetical protein M1814_005394 [Vezdaea aestivalis]